MFKKLILLFFLFINVFQICDMQHRCITPMSLGGEWGPGLFSEAVVYVSTFACNFLYEKICIKKDC